MDIFIIFVIAIVGMGLFFGFLANLAGTSEKELADAKRRYVLSLGKLKSSPTNASLKQSTLALGRAYSNLTRAKRGNTVFDEVALLNDINAACAAASASTLAQPASGPIESIEERLGTLSALKERGLIDVSEYEKRRAEILGSI